MSEESQSSFIGLLPRPNIFVIGLGGISTKDIIEGIIGSDVDKFQTNEDNYNWHIDNKYYTADINVYHMNKAETLRTVDFNGAEAVLLYVDPSMKSLIDEINDVVRLLEQGTFEVQLLIADRFEENVEFTRGEAQNWCLSHGWELVELNQIGTDEVEGGDFADSWGFQRIKQALHAHTWPNLKLKDKDNFSHLLHPMNLNAASYHEDPVPYLELTDSQDAFDVMGNFSELLSSLSDMKERAESLSVDERKTYAEKITIAFWKSIGGDEEETRLETDIDRT